ncbi:hypothetical protein [Flagellimonas eckloniae]|uniref:General secretion pathway protein n=1 Tax=Flagellimonas eckloniae TaxID=346185 RepID=A0A0Q1DKK9_9FLAO|nr:hypothetical protein [Allomuricauda eckloniae]KQC29392.1 hypothetical protein AAY42_05375 [Allomuricauda eckloniae]
MLDYIKTYFTKGNTFYGLEIYQIEGTTQFRLLQVIKKKGELVIMDSQSFGELEMLPSLAKVSVPIYLIYNTDSVITKHAISNFEDRAAVEQVFPGLNFENFFYQISKLKDLPCISVVKKQDVENYLVQLKKMKFNVGGFSLGPCSLSIIVDYLDSDFIFTNTDKLVLNGLSDTNLSISKKNSSVSTYNINGLSVKNTEIMAFSGVLSFLTSNTMRASNFSNVGRNLQSEFVNSRTFGILLRSSLGFILLLLLSNFLLFNFYFDRVQLSKENLAFKNENKKNLTIVRNRVNEKEKKVDAVLSLSNSRTSFYLDKLGASLPKSILLTELLYQPLTKPIQESKPIQLDENRILVMGTSISSEDFSSWITLLETIEWITSVETMDYDYKNKNTSNFKIKISVAEF